MTIIRALAIAVIALLLSAAPPLTSGAGAQPPEPQDEFVPIDQLPPTEEFPAARLVIAAYVFVPVVLFLYLMSLARKMAVVQREIDRLDAELKRST